MDNFLNSFLSSSWSDMNEAANRTWVGSITSQADSLHLNSMEPFQVDRKISSDLPMTPSNHMMGNLSAEDLNVAQEHASSIFSEGSLKYGIGKGLFLGGNLSQCQQPNQNEQSSHGIEAAEGTFSLPDTVSCNSTGLRYGNELNSSLPRSSLAISSSLESSACEQPTFGQSIGEAHSISSVPAVWPTSFSDISSLSQHREVENFSFQGMANDADLLAKSQNEFSSNLVTFAIAQQMSINSEISISLNQAATEITSLQLPSLSNGQEMSFNKANAMPAESQSEGVAIKDQIYPSNIYQQMTQTVSCNAAAKPRVRARRGQATDPHSIAERLRREKIAERMKNLQELVPNSNKTDKASMLDEIIDYVKFLQLQVKVLSMSRLGAAGAVVPLITDVQTEEDGNLHLPSISQGIDLLASQDNLAFEQEVVKLMESSVTTAMQYLQNKGLCLMPIALATAISSQKGPITLPDRTQANGHCNDVIVKQEGIPKSMDSGR